MVATAGAVPPTTVAELGELYRVLSVRLAQIVRLDVRAPEPVIEEACQFAWGSLVSNAAQLRTESVLSWLATTAEREALRLLRWQARDVSLEVAAEAPGELGAAAPPPPHELVERREQLKLIRRLPERQQRVLWLHALGLSYHEIATYTGDSPRTVERQLLRGRKRIRELAASA